MTRARDVADRGVITTADLAGIPSGAKNLIINGDMRIAQRATTVTSIGNSAEFRTVDRWKFAQQTSSTFTMSQNTDVPTGQGFKYSTKLECTSSAALGVNDRVAIWQGIEGYQLYRYIKGTGAVKATLSFWVKSNKTGTFNLELNDTDNSRHICNTYTISSANTWEKKTWVIPEDTGTNPFDLTNTAGLYVNLVFAAGSNYQSGTLSTSWTGPVSTGNRFIGCSDITDATSNYVNVTGVQLEIGDTATPFEHRLYGTELALCQRYYEWGYANHYGGSDGSSNLVTQRPFIVQKRATPTMSYSTTDSPSSPNGNVRRQSASTGGEGDATANNYQVWNHSWSLYAGVSVAHGVARMNFYWYANAEL